ATQLPDDVIDVREQEVDSQHATVQHEEMESKPASFFRKVKSGISSTIKSALDGLQVNKKRKSDEKQSTEIGKDTMGEPKVKQPRLTPENSESTQEMQQPYRAQTPVSEALNEELISLGKVGHSPCKVKKMINKRRLNRKYKLTRTAMFAPEDIDPNTYSDHIQQYFQQYRVLLRDFQSNVFEKVPFGSPVEVGPHMANTLDLRTADNDTKVSRLFDSDPFEQEQSHSSPVARTHWKVGSGFQPIRRSGRNIKKHTQPTQHILFNDQLPDIESDEDFVPTTYRNKKLPGKKHKPASKSETSNTTQDEKITKYCSPNAKKSHIVSDIQKSPLVKVQHCDEVDEVNVDDSDSDGEIEEKNTAEPQRAKPYSQQAEVQMDQGPDETELFSESSQNKSFNLGINSNIEKVFPVLFSEKSSISEIRGKSAKDFLMRIEEEAKDGTTSDASDTSRPLCKRLTRNIGAAENVKVKSKVVNAEDILNNSSDSDSSDHFEIVKKKVKRNRDNAPQRKIQVLDISEQSVGATQPPVEIQPRSAPQNPIAFIVNGKMTSVLPGMRIVTIAPPDPLSKCPMCDQMFGVSVINDHASHCEGQKNDQTCPLCQKLFHKDEIENHAAGCQGPIDEEEDDNSAPQPQEMPNNQGTRQQPHSNKDVREQSQQHQSDDNDTEGYGDENVHETCANRARRKAGHAATTRQSLSKQHSQGHSQNTNPTHTSDKASRPRQVKTRKTHSCENCGIIFTAQGYKKHMAICGKETSRRNKMEGPYEMSTDTSDEEVEEVPRTTRRGQRVRY
ncbi:unnamed protein product, partial [Owenia fusiformis]